ncbi:MAG: membrane protein insertase YidC, partial [Acidobacteriota bacterium]|nr:membrane protein insertase YidC [Acidobacteriota bacterium]
MSSPNLPEPKSKKADTKEMPNEVRMVLAFVLMGVILVATPWVYKKLGITSGQQPTPPVKSAVQAHPAEKSAPQPAADADKGQVPPAEPAQAEAAASESQWTIDTKLFHVVFSNRGAVVKSWVLKNIKDSEGKPLELVNQKGAEKYGFPFTFEFRGQRPSTDLNKALWVAHPSGDGTSIEYDFSDGKTTAKKTLAFAENAYMVQVADEVRLNGTGLPHLIQWRGGFGDMAANNAYSHQSAVYYDSDKSKLVQNTGKSAKNGPEHADGNYSFAGIQDQYFTAVFLAPPNTPFQTTTFDDTAGSAYDNSDQPYPGVAVGGDARNQLGLYVGPKEINSLNRINPRLSGLIDWGFFGILAKPLFFALQWLTNTFVHNYGWAIILLTVLINTALFPLKLANLRSMRKMQALQPEMNRINEKYKGISMSDPRASQKQQEVMGLYKAHGVNPLGGCIPMLIQLPFLYAFYRVLAVTFEMRNASWLWVADLSQPEHFAIRLLPIVMVASSFLMQKMTP